MRILWKGVGIFCTIVYKYEVRDYTRTRSNHIAFFVENGIVMRRASETSLFSLGFPRKKKPLHNGSYEHRVPKIKTKHFSARVIVCDSTS